MSDHRDNYAPRLKGRHALPPLAHAGRSSRPRYRNARRRDAIAFALGVAFFALSVSIVFRVAGVTAPEVSTEAGR